MRTAIRPDAAPWGDASEDEGAGSVWYGGSDAKEEEAAAAPGDGRGGALNGLKFGGAYTFGVPVVALCSDSVQGSARVGMVGSSSSFSSFFWLPPLAACAASAFSSIARRRSSVSSGTPNT